MKRVINSVCHLPFHVLFCLLLHVLTRALKCVVCASALSFLLLGVQYYKDLNTPVTKKEAVVISDIVEKTVKAVLPGAIITLTGGFRRYKHTVHILYCIRYSCIMDHHLLNFLTPLRTAVLENRC